MLAVWKGTTSASVWELKLDLAEVNKSLAKGKCKAELELCSEKAKKQKVEAELRDITNELREAKSTCKQIYAANKALSHTIACGTQGRGRKACKSLCDLSRQRKTTRKKQAVANIQVALSFLENGGLMATSVNVVDVTKSQIYMVNVKTGIFFYFKQWESHCII